MPHSIPEATRRVTIMFRSVAVARIDAGLKNAKIFALGMIV
jgi:hypothetical protein